MVAGFSYCVTSPATLTMEVRLEMPELQPNHVHADGLDLISPLRIVKLHHERHEYLSNHHALPSIPACDELIAEIERCSAEKRPLRLNPLEVSWLVASLTEAVYQAHRDNMPKCAHRMEKLRHELRSNRVPMLVVVGRCSVCWPNS